MTEYFELLVLLLKSVMNTRTALLTIQSSHDHGIMRLTRLVEDVPSKTSLTTFRMLFVLGLPLPGDLLNYYVVSFLHRTHIGGT